MLVSFICDLLLNSNCICTEFKWLGRDPRNVSARRKIMGKYVGVKFNLRIGNATCTEFTGWAATAEVFQHTKIC